MVLFVESRPDSARALQTRLWYLAASSGERSVKP